MTYCIVGDTPTEKERLLCVCGSDKEIAENALFAMLHFERDVIGEYENLKIVKM